MGKLYITGDTHGSFYHLHEFFHSGRTSIDDVLVVLGDAGVNYFLDKKDKRLKKELSKWPITFFFVRGNHEERPANIPSYRVKDFAGGVVFEEDEYPNLKFAIDGIIYPDLCGKSVVTIGGAYSVDKWYRLANNWQWFKDEQLHAVERDFIAANLKGKKVDYVFSHTCPLEYQPRELFLSSINQNLVDDNMEKWMQKIKDEFIWDKWFFGHYHANKCIEPNHVYMLYDKVIRGDEEDCSKKKSRD